MSGIEDVCDDHWRTTLCAHVDTRGGLLSVGGLLGWLGWQAEKFASASQAPGTALVGKQPVVPDSVKAVWQDVDEEAANELVRVQDHGFVPTSPFGSIIFPLEGDAVLIEGD